MIVRVVHSLRYLAPIPIAIAVLAAVAALGFRIPNEPLVVLLAVTYCAYRGGLGIGLVGSALQLIYTAIFLSDPHHLFVYSGDGLTRTIVWAAVAPGMAVMIGLLRREADRMLARERAAELALLKLNAELEERVGARTAELVEARRMAEAAQAKAWTSEARFRDFADAASDWLWEQDENLRFSYFSSEAFSGSRETAKKHLGKTRREVGNAVLSDAGWDAHEADLAARRPFRNMVTKRYAPDGKLRYTSTSGRPFFDEHGKFRGYRGTARDVTKEMLAELDLERQVNERTEEVHALQRKLVEQERRATLDQLTATVSHELRNPLSAIRNSIYVIANTARAGNLSIERPLDRIDRSLRRCESIIAQLVEYSQIRALQRQSVRIDKWLTKALDEQVLPDGIALTVELGAPRQMVSCDPDHLRRVIAALIENSVQAIERAWNDQPDRGPQRITVRSRVVGERMEIEIADSGPGIAPDVLKRMFEPLYSTKPFGVGLGLPLVKQILDYHGGGIDITSELGHGARAVIWLPVAAAEEIAA